MNTAAKLDPMLYTVLSPDETRTVNVGEFRGAIEHLERLVHYDYHSAHGPAEKADWLARTKRVGAHLIGLFCKRATADDWMRRERVLDRSTALIEKCR